MSVELAFVLGIVMGFALAHPAAWHRTDGYRVRVEKGNQSGVRPIDPAPWSIRQGWEGRGRLTEDPPEGPSGVSPAAS